MKSPHEPKLKELLEIKKTLTTSDEDMKKINAINLQIKRKQASSAEEDV